MRYRGVHAIVTGGSSGFGRALVARIVDRGSDVSILALGDHDLERVAADYAASARTVTTYAADVAARSRSRRPSPTILDRLVRTAPGLTQRWLDSKVAGVAQDR